MRFEAIGAFPSMLIIERRYNDTKIVSCFLSVRSSHRVPTQDLSGGLGDIVAE